MLRDTEFLIAKAKSMGYTPEQYRNSRERLEILNAFIQNGEDAKTIRDFAEAIVNDTGNEVNEILLKNTKADLNVLRGYLRGAILFQQKVEATIQMGEKKRQKLKELKESERGV